MIVSNSTNVQNQNTPEYAIHVSPLTIDLGHLLVADSNSGLNSLWMRSGHTQEVVTFIYTSTIKVDTTTKK